MDLAPSSSGLGHQVLILKIAGSNPAGVTKLKLYSSLLLSRSDFYILTDKVT